MVSGTSGGGASFITLSGSYDFLCMVCGVLIIIIQ